MLVMRHPAPDPSLALEYLTGHRSAEPLCREARRLRDAGKGRTVTYSRKVFIPITTLCRDRCAYCTFARPPGAGGEYMTPEEVMAMARVGERYGCTEALLTLGDRPEARWSEARSFLDRQECASTLGYVQRMSERIVTETSLFPHANAGVMDEGAIEALRPSNVSMGLMLENVSPRLMKAGMPHFGSPDKDPAVRVGTIEAAGRARVPFTTGVLVGIGEMPEEIVDSLFALAALHARHRNVQEIIVQNFRAKADTPMRRSAEPTPELVSRVAALARWICGAEMNIQVPPNLTDRFEVYLDAGVNDWGGVSPVTIDWVNPEQPWPDLDELESRTEAAGFHLRARLPVYPEFIDAQWIDPALLVRVRSATDASGFALVRAPA
ncbi:MAG TPA: 7,8-didemethyl-8-hydroxy-5-deazariboflavin synthase subunit CofG [Actinobacteria bacterium]|nr:7,8-didemethyl-8-hydroxy-5-deazariboflavin synthase subunit CofG [Actinomycetota bacterium]